MCIFYSRSLRFERSQETGDGMHFLAGILLAYSYSSGKQNKGMEIAHQFPFIWRSLLESGLAARTLTCKERSLFPKACRTHHLGPQSYCVLGRRQMLTATPAPDVGVPACVQIHRALAKGLCLVSGWQASRAGFWVCQRLQHEEHREGPQ